MNKTDTGCPELDSLAMRVARLEEMAARQFNRSTEGIRRSDRHSEQIKQIHERNRELQRQIDRLYRVGLDKRGSE